MKTSFSEYSSTALLCLALLFSLDVMAFSPKHPGSLKSKPATGINNNFKSNTKKSLLGKPDTFTNRILTAHAGSLTPAMHDHAKGVIWFNVKKSKSADASDQALRLVERLLEEQEITGDTDILSMGQVVNVLTACRRNSVESGTLSRLTKVMHMLERSTIWDDSVLPHFVGALANCKAMNAPKSAEHVLIRMQKRGIIPNERHFGTVLSSYAKRGKVKEVEMLMNIMSDLHASGQLEQGPTRITMTTALYALSRSGEKNAPGRAQALVKKMEVAHADGNRDMKPDIIAYSNLLNCFTSHKMTKDAEELLLKVESLYDDGFLQKGPDTIFYSSVLNAIAQSCDDDAFQRAEALLHRMECRGVRPNIITYNSLVKCFLNQASPSYEQMKDLVQKVQYLYESGQLKGTPDNMQRFYRSMMSAFVKSDAGKETDAMGLW
eukprot:CAMPEP_0194417232 /NCGR_PEP_ID=MMETSP0176-20130528/16271_1 /TAXON_ID=216777 /ORGANISM="Proboscia alata, Strain PI-D3" /LENGTH=434 /DNA_ID=CAMNT_0039222975 /DNA_START=102 /DNA_END=1403 /DNA_ORIENTATION=+